MTMMQMQRRISNRACKHSITFAIRIGFLLAFALLALNHPIPAMGGSSDQPPRIPQAISAAELQRTGDLLKLSDDQRHAVEIEYERYLDDFEPLRAEMIEIAVQHPRWSATERELVASLPGFVARVHALDEEMFARIEPLLVESQRPGLARVRSTRQRSMLTELGFLASLIGDGIPDMRERLELLNPPAETLAPLEEQLAAYQITLDAGIVALFSEMVNACHTCRDNADGSYAPDNNVDPKAAEQVIHRIRTLRAMNRKLFDDLAPSLPSELRMKWRDELYLYAYSGLKGLAELNILKTLNAVLASELTEAERAAVVVLRDKAQELQEAAWSKVMIVIDQAAAAPAPHANGPYDNSFFDGLQAVNRDLNSHDAELRTPLYALISKERIRKAPWPERDTPEVLRAGGQVCGVVARWGRVQTGPPPVRLPYWRAQPLWPEPILRQELDVWIAALGLDGSQRDWLLEQFAAYDKELDVSLKPLREEASIQSMHRRQQEDPLPADPLARAKAAETLRMNMRTAVDAADRDFIQALRARFTTDADALTLDRLTRWRARTIIKLGDAWESPERPNFAAQRDLMQMLLSLHLDAETWKAIDVPASAYEARLTGMLAESCELYSKYMFNATALGDGWWGDGPDSNTPQGHNTAVAKWYELGEDLHKRYRDLAAFNQESAATLVAALPAPAGASLLDAFNGAAYPKACDDPACMKPALERAAAIAELDPTQRQHVDDTRLEFNTAYDDVTASFIRLCAACWPDMPMITVSMGPDRTERDERFQQESTKLTDRRSEINRKALRGLRMALSPKQLRSLQVPDVN